MHHLLNLLNALSSFQARRGDDELTATWKAKQREVLASIGWMVVALVAGLIVGKALDIFDSNSILAGLSDGLRGPASYAFLAVAGFCFLRMCFGIWDAFRFARDHGVE